MIPLKTLSPQILVVEREVGTVLLHLDASADWQDADRAVLHPAPRRLIDLRQRLTVPAELKLLIGPLSPNGRIRQILLKTPPLSRFLLLSAAP